MSEDRVEELMRVNAELAAEIRNLTAGRTEVSRPRQAPAARRVARLLGERDALVEELERMRGELEATRADLEGTQNELAATRTNRDDLDRQNHALATEVARLRGGTSGTLRRIRGRLRSSVGEALRRIRGSRPG